MFVQVTFILLFVFFCYRCSFDLLLLVCSISILFLLTLPPFPLHSLFILSSLSFHFITHPLLSHSTFIPSLLSIHFHTLPSFPPFSHLFRLESFTELSKLSKDVPDETPLLALLATRFEAGTYVLTVQYTQKFLFSMWILWHSSIIFFLTQYVLLLVSFFFCFFLHPFSSHIFCINNDFNSLFFNYLFIFCSLYFYIYSSRYA